VERIRGENGQRGSGISKVPGFWTQKHAQRISRKKNQKADRMAYAISHAKEKRDRV
jgi:predicted transcriptional regulator YdeE